MEKNEKLPRHVSIIMDGNGRWARKRGLPRTLGHKEGAESVRACIRAAADAGIPYLSFFAFSEENWNRPEEEVSGLMDLMGSAIKRELPSFIENGIRCVVLGHLSRLSPELVRAIRDAEEKTRGLNRLTVIIFLSYSGKWDILQAAKRLCEACAGDPERLAAVDEADFSRLLVTGDFPDPDLIIRTSGEQRISNYLLWQGAYSEFYFTATLWPDFREASFREALAAYASRDRRYGKVK